MKTNRLFRPLALALLAVAAALPGAARAQDTLTETYQFPVTNFSAIPLTATLTAPFSQFDPSLGTLTGATFNWEYDLSVHEQWSNNGENYYLFTGPVGINDPNQNTLQTYYYNFIVGGSGGGNNFETERLPNFMPYSVPQYLGLLQGTGSYSLVWNAGCGPSVGSNGGYAAVLGVSLNSTSFVTVTYTYTPAVVPEPSTWALLGVGAGVLGVTWRRRPRAA
jgi:hypothetical protein